MNRVTLLSFFVVIGGTAVLLASSAQSQSGVPKNQVVLQPSTPGTSQSGHSNITGTARAGQFVGGGSGLSGVNADLLDGINSSAFLQAVPNPLILSGSVLLGPTIRGTNSSNSNNATGVYGEATGATALVRGVYGTASGTSGVGVYGFASGTSSSAGFFKNSSFLGTGLTVESAGNGIVSTVSDVDSYAVRGISETTSGSFPGYGVYGEANNDRGFGVYGINRSTSPTGYGAYGVKGLSLNPIGSGVEGSGYIGVSGSGDLFGGNFGTNTETGSGVRGFAFSFTGTAIGGEFGANSPSGWGLFSKTYATTGTNYGGRFETNSDTGRAVYALATATGATDSPYGVRGQASTSTDGYGVYSVGDMGASGVKPFRIDHPSDPVNKYLLHYSSESPFPQNFYNGNVTTDASGYAWVELPDYFGEINTNIKYQLTIVDNSDDFVMAKVTDEVKNNRFRIRTSKPNIKVSWEVKADRNDARVQWKRPTDVMEKVGSERGKYQHPEYYHQPESMGMDYRPATKKEVNQAGKSGLRLSPRPTRR